MKMNDKKLMSLSHREIIGFDDEYININITKFKKYFYSVFVSIGYIFIGLHVGWSSKILLLHDQSKEFDHLTRDEISWIVSIYPLTIVFASLFLHQLYYWFGTKYLILMATISMIFSWILPLFFDEHGFYSLLLFRFIGGIGSGIILILVPLYMKEIGGLLFSTAMVDILIVQFGIGIFIQYLLDFLTFSSLSIISVLLSLLYFFICCAIPESPRYKYFCDKSRKQDFDIERDERLRNLWSEEDLQQKSITDLFFELRKSKLLSLIGLIMIEQLIGGISILFYLKYFAQLTGGANSTEWIPKAVGLTLVISVPLAKLMKFLKHWTIKKQMKISSILIILCMTFLAILCIVEGVTGKKMFVNIRHFIPLPIFVCVTFFHVFGITRNLWIMIQEIFTSYPLQMHLRVLCTVISWLIIFIITKILPKLLYLVGVGYFYAYSVIFMIISLIFLQKIVPDSFNLKDCKALQDSNSLSTSSYESENKSANSLCNEIQEI